MIQDTVHYLKGRLDEYVRGQITGSIEPVALASVHEADGARSDKITDKLVLSFVKADQDTSLGRPPTIQQQVDQHLVQRRPPLHLNISVLLAASFGNYDSALRHLSVGMNFFQSYPSLNRTNAPDLPAHIDRLDAQMENLSLHDLSNLWGVMGGRHLPGVFYQLRVVSMDAHHILHSVEPVGDTRVSSAT